MRFNSKPQTSYLKPFPLWTTSDLIPNPELFKKNLVLTIFLYLALAGKFALLVPQYKFHYP
jgi:hypothetical protein